MAQAFLGKLILFSIATLAASGPSVQIVDVTLQDAFDAHVGQREGVWAVLFAFGTPGAFWSSSATKVPELVHFGRVDCTKIGANSGHAAAPCGRAQSPGAKGKGHILGYSFNKQGERVVSTQTYVSSFTPAKIVKWALGLAPRLAIQLTAHSGTNVLHKEEFGNFLKRPRMAKALVFTTSPKGEPPALVTALAIRFRQRLLVGEVKASDMTLRNSFAVKSPPAIIVIDPQGKRHAYSGAFKRSPIEAFLDKFASSSPDTGLHSAVKVQTEKVKVKKQSYSDAESQSFPKGFNPWRALGLPAKREVPSKDDLKAAYKTAAKMWHPDKCKTNKQECEVKMSQTSLANNVLSDNRRLQQWEAWREDAARQPRGRRQDL